MNKDDILAKSREENRDRDLYAEEVNLSASASAALVSLLLATVCFLLHFFIKKEFNFGLYAILFSYGATSFIVKGSRMKRRRDMMLAVIYSAGTVAFLAAYLFQLFAASAV